MANITNVGIWQPNSGKQTDAYNSLADELLVIGYGGGKTDLLLGLAGTKHSRSIIVTRKHKSLLHIVYRSNSLYGSNPVNSFNKSSELWRLPEANQTIQFASCQEDKDLMKFRGLSKTFYGYENVDDFTEHQYRTINDWNRPPVGYERRRSVATIQEVHKDYWTYNYWGLWLDRTKPNKALYGELRWFATLNGIDKEVRDSTPIQWYDSIIFPRSRTVIDMVLPDNPYLKNTEYAKKLESLPEPTRSQMLYGKEFRG